MRHYTQLSLRERTLLECYLKRGLPKTQIAKLLGRPRCTIYNELSRNSIEGKYVANKAHLLAKKRCFKKPFKLNKQPDLLAHITEKLKLGWSPEQISGRLKLQSKESLCSESIYHYIYKHKDKRLFSYLCGSRENRKPRAKRKHRSRRIEAKNIRYRPSIIESRETMGHWEGDTIRFNTDNFKSITTLVERVSRMVILIFNEVSDSKTVMGNIKHRINNSFTTRLKDWATITFDQGSEFMDFYEIERNTKCDVYYANIKSPWQRGTNENTNKRLRNFLPRNTYFDETIYSKLRKIQNKMNQTPRKCLGFKTPYEVFYENRKIPNCLT